MRRGGCRRRRWVEWEILRRKGRDGMNMRGSWQRGFGD